MLRQNVNSTEQTNIINYPGAEQRGCADTYTLFGDYPDMLTMEQMQEALGIGRSTAYKLTQSGELGHIRLGKSIRIPKSELIFYIQKGLQTCYNDRRSGRANHCCQKGKGE